MDEEENKRCFVIMPFSTPKGYEENHFTKIYEQIIKPAVIKAGLKPERVDEDFLSTDIVTKIFKGLTECDMAICDLSSRNPNVLYELGIRQAYNKPVLLIKDEKTENIFDVGGLTTISYESNRLYENVIDAVERISQALIDNLSNKESVVDIIRGRLGGKFEASKIPTGKSMDKDDMIISLLSSLTEDMDSIKRRINRDNNVYFVNDISASSYEKIRKELVEIRDYLKSMDEKDAGNINVENFLRICNRYIHMPKNMFMDSLDDVIDFINDMKIIL